MDRRFLILIYLVFFISACSKNVPEIRITKNFSSKTCRVIVLPFENQTKDPTINRVFYRILIDSLIEEGLFVVPEGQVRRFFIMERYLVGENIPLNTIKLLAERTNTKIFIDGSILTYEKNEKNLKLAFIINIKDAYSGKILCSTYHVRTSEDYRKILHFGKVYTTSGLIKKMINEVLMEWRRKGLFSC
ncbi:hypothetical protein Thein_1793 [Thermodesulfatator indicus DSM 15286]|uniref:Lipoprotein n=1 Tax=Thermodesulfatator indicus (strain DSM 15286 / JCM 11887 / CIR29812) TaxID=667014 RepID=F8ABV7_THEID|nr:hypothetical protein [Thermodesulfatator indicus]AEH45649.1 hypothetical protein Thein_1793 [Thermodesulfatator indicus DSM 15286]